MLDWFGWIADLLLNAGADVASLFVSRDAPGFVLFACAIAGLVVAAAVFVIICCQSLIEYWRSRWRPRA
jgi:hypothetical protein